MDWAVFWSEYISNMIRVENQNFLYFYMKKTNLTVHYFLIYVSI